MELKELGFEAKVFKDNNNEYSDEVMVKAIIIKVKSLFENKSPD